MLDRGDANHGKLVYTPSTMGTSGETSASTEEKREIGMRKSNVSIAAQSTGFLAIPLFGHLVSDMIPRSTAS